jgi:HflK protein
VYRLRQLGIQRILLLTGDRRPVAESIARQVGITEVHAQLLPEEKLEKIRELQASGFRVAMVGDGINDAPALAAANVGIALGGTSIDVTAEAADIVYLAHGLDRLPLLVDVSHQALATVRQNFWLFALLTNVVGVSAATLGIIGPVGAAVFHQSSSFLVMLNSLRLLRAHSPFDALRAFMRRPVVVRCGAACREMALQAPQIAWRAWRDRERLWKPALSLAALLWVLSGIYAVRPQETAVVQRFGRQLSPNRGPGLHYALPWPIDRVTRVEAARIRALELGFRTLDRARGGPEPAAYEWNVAHRTGRYEQKLEEALMLTGDQNMVTLNAVVHYAIDQPGDYLFRIADPEAAIRACGESAIRATLGTSELDIALTTGRGALEARAKQEIQTRLDRSGPGLRVLSVRLQDVHPPLEVVGAFRDVSSAFEEKNRMVNEAEAYRNQQVALARGKAASRLEEALAYRFARANRAMGDADRFTQADAAYRTAPGPTETRLFLETMEEVLPGRSKLILDSSGKGRRAIMTVDAQSLKLLLPELTPSGPAEPPSASPRDQR